MHNFYISVHRYGNNLLYRGYNQSGIRIKKKIWFKPELFLKSKQDSEFKSLLGARLRPINFDSMSAAKDFIEQYKGVDEHEVFGMQNYIYQYINQRFPGQIQYTPSIINVNTLDIEVASDDGFPEPSKAEKEIISIACKSTTENVWRVWGLGDYDSKKSYILEKYSGHRVVYVHCKNEIDLIKKFLIKWSSDDYCPDVITGWYIRFFDIPYLVNRIRQVLGQDVANLLSPWKRINQRHVQFKGGKTSEAFELIGIQTLDYQDLFIKFAHTFGTQESYSLDHIASVVLGDKKISYEEYGNLDNLFKENHQLAIEYNIKDIDIVVRLEQELGLIQLVFNMAYRGGVNYTDVLGTTAIWDSIINRALYAKKIIIPPEQHKFKSNYPGGYVKTPQIGMHDWVVSFDLNSLYPNLIVQYNMSPETIRNEPGHRETVQGCLDKPDKKVTSKNAVAANGICFSKDFRGILPEIVIDYYDERKKMKGKMIEAKKLYEKDKTHENKIKMDEYENSQMSIKLLLNSLYGALGSKYFRFFDMRIAEAITLSGQLSILWAEKTLNGFMNSITGTKNIDYVLAIDTDSCYLNFGPYVKKFNIEDPEKHLDKLCVEKIEPILEKSYIYLSKKMNSYENRMVMGREVIASRGIWTAKKRYILNVLNNEGVQYSEPKLKIMGIEAIKSSTPKICRDKFKEIFKIIMTDTENVTQKFIADFRQEFSSLNPEEIAMPRGVSHVQKYLGNRTHYIKGTPINSRAAILYNARLIELGLEKKFEKIYDGSKIKYLYLKKPNPIRENIIGFPQYLPKEFKLNPYIDYELQFQKTFLDPLKLILDAIEWSSEKQSNLDEFFT